MDIGAIQMHHIIIIIIINIAFGAYSLIKRKFRQIINQSQMAGRLLKKNLPFWNFICKPFAQYSFFDLW